MNIDDVKKYITNRASDHMDEKCCSQAEVDRSAKERDEVLRWIDAHSFPDTEEVSIAVTLSQLEYIFKAAENVRQSKENYNHDTDTYLRNIVENNRVEAIDIQNLIKHLKGER